jgi:hypothetical protein
LPETGPARPGVAPLAVVKFHDFDRMYDTIEQGNLQTVLRAATPSSIKKQNKSRRRSQGYARQKGPAAEGAKRGCTGDRVSKRYPRAA